MGLVECRVAGLPSRCSSPSRWRARSTGSVAACGDPRRGRIAPHITLVPPVNVGEDELDVALGVCREAAAVAPVMRLVLGAPSSFAPETPLAWLSVTGDVGALAELRTNLDGGPLSRPPDHTFVPHVTISGKVPGERLEAMLAALADFEAAISIERLDVLENRQLSDGRWGWVPLEEVAFGRPAVVGRGGIPLELAVGSVLDRESEALLGVAAGGTDRRLVVTARREGVLVGVALGTADGDLARLDALAVAEGHRRQGVGSHLLARFAAAASERGCTAATRVAVSGDGVSDLCRLRGWSEAASVPAVGTVTLIRLLADR